MADWTTLNLETLLPGEPLTSAKVTAMYENPIAISEGATDAPRVVGPALNLFPLYLTGSTATATTPVETDEFPVAARLFNIAFSLGASWNSGGTGVGRLQMAYSTDGGATFGGYQTIINTGTVSSSNVGEAIQGSAILDIANGRIVGSANGTFTAAGATVNALAFRIASSTGGTTAAGSCIVANIGSSPV